MDIVILKNRTDTCVCQWRLKSPSPGRMVLSFLETKSKVSDNSVTVTKTVNDKSLEAPLLTRGAHRSEQDGDLILISGLPMLSVRCGYPGPKTDGL